MLLLDMDQRAWSRRLGCGHDASEEAEAEAERADAQADVRARYGMSNRQTGARSGWVRRRRQAKARKIAVSDVEAGEACDGAE